MYNIFYVPQAEQDLVDIRNYISKDNSIQAGIVMDHIFSFVNVRLSLYPKMGPSLNNLGYRYIVEQKYRYKIIYKFDGTIVVVYSVSKYKNTPL